MTKFADTRLTIADATCIHCGCTCDDVQLTVEGNRIREAAVPCELGRRWFLGQSDDARPACRIDGVPADLDAGLDRAAELLLAARYPLVYGLDGSPCEAQRVAVALADWLGATIDTPTSSEQGPLGVSFQGVGEVTASLGEVANRGDLIIYWGANPVETHPRHLSKYSLDPRGMFVPRGRRDRTLVVVDVRKTQTAELADLFIQIRPSRDFEAFWILRALAQDLPLDAAQVLEETDVPLAVWQDLVARLRRAKFGALFYGEGLSGTRGGHINTEALFALVRDLNAHTRFVARPMRKAGNGVGADNVLAWQTGFPFGVNLSRGYPRFNPGEFTAAGLLARREVDAALIVDSGPLTRLSRQAREHLASIPTIALGWQETPEMQAASVSFATAVTGIHTPGTVYRMDDVPLPLRAAVTSLLPTSEQILLELERRVRALRS